MSRVQFVERGDAVQDQLGMLLSGRWSTLRAEFDDLEMEIQQLAARGLGAEIAGGADPAVVAGDHPAAVGGCGSRRCTSRPDHRRCGVGRSLLAACQAWAAPTVNASIRI